MLEIQENRVFILLFFLKVTFCDEIREAFWDESIDSLFICLFIFFLNGLSYIVI